MDLNLSPHVAYCILTPENPLDRREEAARPGRLPLALTLLIPTCPISFSVALVLRRRGRFVHLDVHDLVTREVTEDELPRHLGHAHKLVGTPDEQVDTVAVMVAQLGPELQHIIDGLVVSLGGRCVCHVLVIMERQDVDGFRDGCRRPHDGRHRWW